MSTTFAAARPEPLLQGLWRAQQGQQGQQAQHGPTPPPSLTPEQQLLARLPPEDWQCSVVSPQDILFCTREDGGYVELGVGAFATASAEAPAELASGRGPFSCGGYRLRCTALSLLESGYVRAGALVAAGRGIEGVRAPASLYQRPKETPICPPAGVSSAALRSGAFGRCALSRRWQ